MQSRGEGEPPYRSRAPATLDENSVRAVCQEPVKASAA